MSEALRPPPVPFRSDNEVLKAIHVVIDNAVASPSLLERIRSALLDDPGLGAFHRLTVSSLSPSHDVSLCLCLER